MPALNEEGCIIQTLERFTDVLSANVGSFEIVVVDDGSTDATADRLRAFSVRHPEVVPVTNTGRHGFGMAIRYGLTRITGDAVAILELSAVPCTVSDRDHHSRLGHGVECLPQRSDHVLGHRTGDDESIGVPR